MGTYLTLCHVLLYLQISTVSVETHCIHTSAVKYFTPTEYHESSFSIRNIFRFLTFAAWNQSLAFTWPWRLRCWWCMIDGVRWVNRAPCAPRASSSRPVSHACNNRYRLPLTNQTDVSRGLHGNVLAKSPCPRITVIMHQPLCDARVTDSQARGAKGFRIKKIPRLLNSQYNILVYQSFYKCSYYLQLYVQFCVIFKIYIHHMFIVHFIVATVFISCCISQVYLSDS